MQNKKEHKYGTGNIIDDFPHYPDNYRDHRTYIYQLAESKIQTHPNKIFICKCNFIILFYFYNHIQISFIM